MATELSLELDRLFFPISVPNFNQLAEKKNSLFSGIRWIKIVLIIDWNKRFCQCTYFSLFSFFFEFGSVIIIRDSFLKIGKNVGFLFLTSYIHLIRLIVVLKKNLKYLHGLFGCWW